LRNCLFEEDANFYTFKGDQINLIKGIQWNGCVIKQIQLYWRDRYLERIWKGKECLLVSKGIVVGNSKEKIPLKLSIYERDINEFEMSDELIVKYFKWNINNIKIWWKDDKVILLYINHFFTKSNFIHFYL